MPSAPSLQNPADRSVKMTGKPMIIFNLFNQSEDSSLLGRMFPSLVGDAGVILLATDGQFVLECDTDDEARTTFSRVACDAATNYTAMIEGDVMLVIDQPSGHVTRRIFDVLDSEYPVHENGSWRKLPAPDRD